MATTITMTTTMTINMTMVITMTMTRTMIMTMNNYKGQRKPPGKKMILNLLMRILYYFN